MDTGHSLWGPVPKPADGLTCFALVSGSSVTARYS